MYFLTYYTYKPHVKLEMAINGMNTETLGCWN